MHRFPTERARLKVRNPAGDVKIETADVAETTVELMPLNESDATRQAIEKANVTARGDDVIVELEGGRGWSITIGGWGIGSAKVSVRITCPNGSDLECDTASADIRVAGTLGSADPHRVRRPPARPGRGRVRGEERQRRHPGRARRGPGGREHRFGRRRRPHRDEPASPSTPSRATRSSARSTAISPPAPSPAT